MAATVDNAPRQRWRNYRVLVVALSMAVVVLVYLAWSGYRDVLRTAAATTVGVARLNAFSLGASLITADILLADLASQAAPLMANRSLLARFWDSETPRIEHYLTRVPDVGSFHIVDRDGYVNRPGF